MIRKVIFWAHLVTGVLAGAVILIMSLTGVLLTYEYQMIESADMKLMSAQNTDAPRISMESALQVAGQYGNASSVVVRNNIAAPYEVSFGRRGRAFIDAYTGEYLGEGEPGMRNFMSSLRSWHRWLNVNGDGRDTARAITGASNAIFLFILISGIYLWLPKVWNRASLSIRLWLKLKPTNSKVRDYNWHHAMGIWTVIPLIALVATALVISYPAVRGVMNDLTAESGSESEESAEPAIQAIVPPQGAELLGMNQLMDITQQQLDRWYKITLTPASNGNAPAQAVIAYTNAIQPTQQETWQLNPYTGEVIGKNGWHDLSRQAQAGQVARRLHTGEFYGVFGQTIAGIVSLIACFMVYTGIALAWRRLISPLFNKAQ